MENAEGIGQAMEQQLAQAMETVRFEGERELRLAVQQAYLDIGKGMLDRALTRANFVTAGAGAIGTLYSGLLALAFKAEAGQTNLMSIAVLVPAILLGIAITLSAIYAARLGGAYFRGAILPQGDAPRLQEERLSLFLEWVTTGVELRAWALDTSVICLGLGVALMPLPYMRLSDRLIIGIAVAVALLVLAVLVQRVYTHSKTRNPPRYTEVA